MHFQSKCRWRWNEWITEPSIFEKPCSSGIVCQIISKANIDPRHRFNILQEQGEETVDLLHLLIFFTCFLVVVFFLSDPPWNKGWAVLKSKLQQGSRYLPGVPSKALLCKPDVFGVLTLSSRTCHSCCPASEMQSQSKNFVTDPIPPGEPRSHADRCFELFMSEIEDGCFRVTVHQVSSTFLFRHPGRA